MNFKQRIRCISHTLKSVTRLELLFEEWITELNTILKEISKQLELNVGKARVTFELKPQTKAV